MQVPRWPPCHRAVPDACSSSPSKHRTTFIPSRTLTLYIGATPIDPRSISLSAGTPVHLLANHSDQRAPFRRWAASAAPLPGSAASSGRATFLSITRIPCAPFKDHLLSFSPAACSRHAVLTRRRARPFFHRLCRGPPHPHDPLLRSFQPSLAPRRPVPVLFRPGSVRHRIDPPGPRTAATSTRRRTSSAMVRGTRLLGRTAGGIRCTATFRTRRSLPRARSRSCRSGRPRSTTR